MSEEHLSYMQMYFKFLFDSNTTLHIVELGTLNEMVDSGFLSESKLQSVKDLRLCWLYALKIASFDIVNIFF